MSRAVPLLFFALALIAQTPDTAIIHGQVTDRSRAPVPGVRILVRNTQSGLERTVQTDTSGHFSLSGFRTEREFQIAKQNDEDAKGIETAFGYTFSDRTAGTASYRFVKKEFPALVREDVLDDFTTIELAREAYGVVFADEASFEIDEEATAAERAVRS